ncbi:MAG: conjugal transfer protein TraD [Sphingopyxis sp.]|nr:conjugal transfer protein TraD [Sphingopyxis sp.]
MRKPRDYDWELQALADKARALKGRRTRELGELVTATGADALDADILAGALIAAKANGDLIQKEEWRATGADFFQARSRQSRRRGRAEPKGGAEREGGGASSSSPNGAG